MEGGESPLDVLSRAATMVQENQVFSSSDDSAKQHPINHKQTTTKWKRDRRRLPDYSRKSDPKFSETFGVDASPSPAASSDGETPTRPSSVPTNGHHNDTPLDMSLRQRGQPPSYAQAMSDPVYRAGYRPSVIHNGAPTAANRDELPSSISMCDPIIDEHFRRSLGNDYHAVFQNNNVSKESGVRKSPPPRVAATTNVIELIDGAGLSVDDHFAKALGDTWAKLNRKDAEMKRDNVNDNLVSI